MSGPAPAPPADGAALLHALDLLERAVAYTRASLQLVTVGALRCPTPCRLWDLDALLHHMVDSLDALQQAADVGAVDPDPTGDGLDDLVTALRTRACSLLGAWTNDPAQSVAVAGRPLPASIVATAGALEITVHGWDVAQACGHVRPLPDALATELLAQLPVLVDRTDRGTRFGWPVAVGPSTTPGARLLAQLGRPPAP